MPEITRLFVYPIKSCRGIAVDTAVVAARGLVHDRRYMIVDANSRFVTQRQHPRMALIDVAFDGGGYKVEAPSMRPLRLPLALGDSTECEVRIWKDRVQANLADPETNLWFSEYMGFACGLVHLADDQHRAVRHESAEFDDEVSFADGAPVLLISEPSLTELNRRLGSPVTMRHFRPNLVVGAEQPHAEDGWRSVTVGGTRFDVGWPCSRCILPTIDPDTGERSAVGEPLETLKKYRRVGRSVVFGQNLLPRAFGTIQVGDELVIEKRESGHEERNQSQSSA